jgi:hypothetical protein
MLQDIPAAAEMPNENCIQGRLRRQMFEDIPARCTSKTPLINLAHAAASAEQHEAPLSRMSVFKTYSTFVG